ncbi:hypothetical protein NQ315_003208 [Exocentrus adspersus]|uniref:Nuclease HARBI1 n=1 Tax=Exocentrus adspersus TaxID=1586481 RepID=A0AAV8VNP5_9CUCU|nr:hypothetical protein NQ315_003208 [Exocentrus adspersus]
MDVVEVAAAASYCAFTYYNFLQVYYKLKIQKPWRKRRWWMTSINLNRTRQSMELQFAELLKEPSGEFMNFCRMSFTDFEFLLNKISPMISRKDTQMRDAIPAKVRLAITLRFLATGDSYRSLHFLFKVSSQIISKIVPEVCEALVEALKDEVKVK